MRPEEEFQARCLKAGITSIGDPRLRIVAVVFQLPEPVTYEALRELAEERGVVASRPTIFRTLEMLTRVRLMVRPDPEQMVWMFTYEGAKFRLT